MRYNVIENAMEAGSNVYSHGVHGLKGYGRDIYDTKARGALLGGFTWRSSLYLVPVALLGYCMWAGKSSAHKWDAAVPLILAMGVKLSESVYTASTETSLRLSKAYNQNDRVNFIINPETSERLSVTKFSYDVMKEAYASGLVSLCTSWIVDSLLQGSSWKMYGARLAANSVIKTFVNSAIEGKSVLSWGFAQKFSANVVGTASKDCIAYYTAGMFGDNISKVVAATVSAVIAESVRQVDVRREGVGEKAKIRIHFDECALIKEGVSTALAAGLEVYLPMELKGAHGHCAVIKNVVVKNVFPACVEVMRGYAVSTVMATGEIWAPAR